MTKFNKFHIFKILNQNWSFCFFIILFQKSQNTAKCRSVNVVIGKHINDVKGIWLCNLVASSNIFRHISQMKAFLLEWAIRWFLKLIPWRKFSWHISHVKDFSPVCVCWCLLNLLARLNFFKQVSHVKDFSPVCVS